MEEHSMEMDHYGTIFEEADHKAQILSDIDLDLTNDTLANKENDTLANKENDTLANKDSPEMQPKMEQPDIDNVETNQIEHSGELICLGLFYFKKYFMEGFS